MDEVVSNCNLVLVFGLVEVFIEHLNEGLLRVELSLVILRVDVYLVLELFGLGDSHDFPPISQ